MGIKFGHEGEAYIGHLHKEQTRSVGLESAKLNKCSAGFKYDGGGINSKIGIYGKESGTGAGIVVDARAFSFQGGWSVDKSSLVPKYKVYGNADLGKFSGKVNYTRAGIEHKVAEANLNGPGVGIKASAGGNSLPSASAEAHVFKPGVSFGVDKASVNLGIGGGPNASASFEFTSMQPDNMSINDAILKPNEAVDKVKGYVKDPKSVISDMKLPVDANAKGSTLGEYSANILGVGSYSDSNKFSPDVGVGSIHYAKDYADSITGRSGTETGNVAQFYGSNKHRDNLIKDADKFHEKSEKRLDKNCDRKGYFATRSNNAIADKSSGYVNKLNTAIDQTQLKKDEIDNKLSGLDPNSKEARKLSSESVGLGNEINRLTAARDNIAGDRDRANGNLNRMSSNQNVTPKSTDQIVSDARNSANNFQNAYDQYGFGKEIDKPAIDIINSKNELNGRVNELDRKINQNNNDISSIVKNRDNYLSQNSMSITEAMNHNDPTVASLNKKEAMLRAQNADLRAEKGECQKALLETNKNFAPNVDCAQYEQKGRNLESQKIDNNNELAAKEDEIANYCNENGITKDSAANYITADNRPDDNLQNLLNEKNDLTKDGKNIENDINNNKRDLANEEKNGKSSLTLSENDGNVDIKQTDDSYKAHAQNNEALRYKDNSQDEANNNSNNDENNSEAVENQAAENEPAGVEDSEAPETEDESQKDGQEQNQDQDEAEEQEQMEEESRDHDEVEEQEQVQEESEDEAENQERDQDQEQAEDKDENQANDQVEEQQHSQEDAENQVQMPNSYENDVDSNQVEESEDEGVSNTTGESYNNQNEEENDNSNTNENVDDMPNSNDGVENENTQDDTMSTTGVGEISEYDNANDNSQDYDNGMPNGSDNSINTDSGNEMSNAKVSADSPSVDSGSSGMDSDSSGMDSGPGIE